MEKLRGRSFRRDFQKPDFTTAVYSVVKKIPKGKTLSYGEVARRAGFPGAARAVGTAMKHNTSKEVPCHRVVRSNGSVGEYAFGGRLRKIARLKKEGVKLSISGKVLK